VWVLAKPPEAFGILNAFLLCLMLDAWSLAEEWRDK
jgi:hypothetical protein